MKTNKIKLTTKILETYLQLKEDKDTIVISPETKINDIFKLTTSGVIIDKIYDNKVNERIIDEKLLIDSIENINNQFNFDLLQSNYDSFKILKQLFAISDQKINHINIKQVLSLLDVYVTRVTKVAVFGFSDSFKAYETEYNMITIDFYINNAQGIITWDNISRLVLVDFNHQEVFDPDRFCQWLSLETRNVITKKDVNDFFNGIININTMQINQALNLLK